MFLHPAPRFLSRILPLLVLLPLGVRQGAEPPAPKPGILDRVAIVGASASAGFGLAREVGRDVHLGDVLEATLTARGADVVVAVDELLFLNPEDLGKKLIASALAAEPTLILGIDFLFWYGYGVVPSEEARLTRLEEGLKLLDGCRCPIVTSRFPDMSPAVGRMLMEKQMPAQETLAKLNERLEAWAKERPNVVLLQLPDILTRMRTGEAITVGSRKYSGPEARRLLQPDELHPTLEGTAVLVVLAFEALRELGRPLPEAALRWDPREIARAVRDATKPAGAEAGGK